MTFFFGISMVTTWTELRCLFAKSHLMPKNHFQVLILKTLKTLGDHLRKRRLDLKLLQREVAQKLGVGESSIYNWENNLTKPALRYIPKIVKFLGYAPYDPATEY